jgi:hypothetical protein
MRNLIISTPHVTHLIRDKKKLTGTPSHFDRTLQILYVIFWQPLWSSRQSSWLQIQRSGFDSRRYHNVWVVGLEWGPLSLVSTTEELLGRKSSVFSLENWDYGRRDSSRWPRGTLYPQKLALTSLTSGGRSIGIVRSRIQATEFSCM